jgi:hypothetical protein
MILEPIFNDETGILFADHEIRNWRNIVRGERLSLLEEADYKINTLLDAGEDISAWRTYRQQLRDVTSNITEVDVVIWPLKPE